MNEIFFQTLIIATSLGLIAAFILILVHKWELHHRWPGFCFFCAGYWLCLLMTIILYLLVPKTLSAPLLQGFFIPVLGSVIAHKMQSSS